MVGSKSYVCIFIWAGVLRLLFQGSEIRKRIMPHNIFDTPMVVETLPDFTPQARKRWESISAYIRKRLLVNVWCTHCRCETTIVNFSGIIKSGNLLLMGKCAECNCDVARVIEGK